MTRSMGRILSVVALAGMVAATPSPVQGQPGAAAADQGACTVYEHADFAGEKRVFDRDAGTRYFGGDSLPNDPGWDDRISSVRCRPGCELTGYDSAEETGAYAFFSGETRNVGPAMNDRISAVRVNCLDSDYACTFYEHADYGGRRDGLRANEMRLMDEFWNDRISSVRCRAGCDLYVYEDRKWGRFNNSNTILRGDVSNVGDHYNDWISRADVLCR